MAPDVELGRARLVAQGLVTRPFRTPAEAVAAFGAMQGQDLPGALASAALRTPDPTMDAVLADLDAGRLVRGYPMRGTVFLMGADDLLWASELCNGPALRAAARRRPQLGLTDADLELARETCAELLTGLPRGLPRPELMAAWQARGLATDGGRGYHLLAHLIGQGEVCFGLWNGTDQNVVATASWLPDGTSLEQRFNSDRIAATAELLQRYLASHAPATLRDFAWWTKLPLREIRSAWALVEGQFEAENAPTDGSWADALVWRPGLRDEVAALAAQIARPLLLPGFDEFILGYADRLFAMTAEQHELLVPGNNGVFRRPVVVDGTVRALWRRAGTSGRRRLEVEPFAPLDAATTAALEKAYQTFPFAAA